MPDAGYFIKKRVLFSSQFEELKAENQVSLSVQPLVRASLAIVQCGGESEKKISPCRRNTAHEVTLLYNNLFS
jgi:hypothetical protein